MKKHTRPTLRALKNKPIPAAPLTPPAPPLTPRELQLLSFISHFQKEKGTPPSRREMASAMGCHSVASIQQWIDQLVLKKFLIRHGLGRARNLSLTAQATLHLRRHRTRSAALAPSDAPRILSESSLTASSLTDRPLTERQQSPSPFGQIPILGEVAAGSPLEVLQTIDRQSLTRYRSSGSADCLSLGAEQWQQLFPRLKPDAELFALRVRGDSMIDEGIWDRDWVIFERAATDRQSHRDILREAEKAPVLALFEGGATLKWLEVRDDGRFLVSANPQYAPMRIREGDDFLIQGYLRMVMRTYG